MRKIQVCHVAAALLLLAGTVLAKDPEMKAGSVLHRTSLVHDHAYSLYVPGNYSPRVSWPLLISSHGRGGSGKGEIGQWTGLAKQHGFIVVCPDMCTATHNRPPNSKLRPEVEDEQVLVSIFKEVCENFRVNRRAVMISGFSGGGNPSYHTGLRHPDIFTHICTRGGNFAPQQVPTDEKTLAAGRKRIQVYIYYGAADHVLILGEGGKPGQAQMAYDALTKAGYENVSIKKIEGMKHQSRPKIAAGWFGEYLKANKKVFLAGDKADALCEKLGEQMEKGRYRDAVRELKKLRKIEKDAGLFPESDAIAKKLTEIADAMIADAKKAHAAGDAGEALKIVGRVARDFRGLLAGDTAKALEKEWKK